MTSAASTKTRSLNRIPIQTFFAGHNSLEFAGNEWNLNSLVYPFKMTMNNQTII